MKIRIIKTSIIAATCVVLLGCGSSNNEIAIETITANIAEDSQWQQSLTFSDTPVVVSNASSGSVSVSTTGITYTPNANYNGGDSITVESGNTRYNISLTVTPVNDAPELSNPQVNVLAGDQITGQLNANDIDGDIVTFTINTAPLNGTLSLQNDGNFTYTPNEFGLPIDSFIVDLNDSTETVQANVELIPAYQTNADKAAYYYRSQSSHLKQANEILASVDDDITTEDAYISLAIGYANAGLDLQLTELLDSNLSTQQARASVFRRLGNFELARDNNDAAADYYLKSLQTYAQYIADNGIENIRTADASFIYTLLSNARAIDSMELSSNIEQQLNLYLDEIGGANTEYVSAFGFFVSAYRIEVQESFAKYQLDRSEENRLIALSNVQRFTNAVQDTGFQKVRRGNNAGKKYYKLAPLYNAEAVGYLFDLGETELAKAQLAYTLAYYGDVNYDDSYTRDALQYAGITQAEYSFPLIEAAYYVTILYPNMETNVAEALVPEGDTFEATSVNNAILDGKATNEVLVNNSVTNGIARVEALYNSSLRSVVERLTSRTLGSDPYFGETLLNLGNTAGAIAAYDRALEILTSDAYLKDNTSNTSRSTGFRGCLKIADFFSRASDTEKLNATALACEDIKNRYFGDSNTDELDVAEAHIDVIDAFTLAGNTEKVNETLVSLSNFLATSSRSDAITRKAQVGVIYLANQNTQAGLDIFTALANELNEKQFDTVDDKVDKYLDVLEALGSLDYEDSSLFNRSSVSVTHKSYFANAQFTQQIASLKSLVNSISDTLIAALV